MSQGTCLCGNVSWTIRGKPQAAYHCHCSMCRKAHGAAFASYYLVVCANFSWNNKIKGIKTYQSSPGVHRAFCSDCGSCVPYAGESGDIVYVPAGSHTGGPGFEAHIFINSKARWHTVSDQLPQFEAYPPPIDCDVYPDKLLSKRPEGKLRGSCLCDAVQFHVTEPFRTVHHCHCSRCRRARSAAFATNGFTSMDGVDFVKGESDLMLYKVPGAKFFTHVYCRRCGSGMPRKDPDRRIAVTPLGALDDDPVSGAVDHIYTKDRAKWYEISDDLPAFPQAPH